MDNDKENNIVPALKIGSGSGSGQKPSSRNHIFTKNLVLRRKELQYTQQKLSDLTGIKVRTIQNYEKGSRPKGDNIITLAETLKCSLDWLCMNKGPDPEPPDGEKQIDKSKPLYSKVEILNMHVAAPGVEYNADVDDFGKAATGLKEIFDSGDPVLIPAIRANIHAFQISVRREAHIQEQTKEINDLKQRMESLERYIKDGDRRKGERRQGDLGLPDGLERRSGSERRKYAAGG